MSKTLAQIFSTNPTTTVADTDLYYLVQSPYTPGTDAAITGASLKAAFGSGGTINPGLVNQIAYYSSSGTSLSGLTGANNAVLITGGTGLPSMNSTLPSAVQSNITALGTIASGVWNGSIITGTFGGTGINNGIRTITLGGNIVTANSFTTSGNFAVTQTYTGITNIIFPTSGTLATTGQIPSLPVSPTNGGTGVSNIGNLTWGAAVTFSGAFASIFTLTGITGVTFPTSGTLSTLAGAETLSNKIISAPQISNIIDGSGHSLLTLASAGASAVNNIFIENSATTFAPQIGVLGSDANISIELITKGIGQFLLNAANTTIPLIISSGTGYQHNTEFSFSNTSATRTVTFPDASGTIAFTSSVPSLPLALASGGTHADLSATGGTSQVLRQSTTGADITVSQLAASDLSNGVNGTGAVSLTTSPTFVTPILGVATATSINFGQTTLNNYQEGTWTPVDASGAALTFTGVNASYTRIGRMVTAMCTFAYPVTVNASAAVVGGLPFTAGGSGGVAGLVTYTGASTLARCLVTPGGTTFNLYNSSGVAILNSAMSNQTSFFMLTYFV